MIPNDSQGLAEAVQNLFGPGVAVAAADPRAPATGLLPEEAPPAGRMIDKRHREFAAGRRAARAAMAALGLPPAAIPMGPDRAPVWPGGVTGSISHTDTHCLAAVTRTDATRAGDVKSLGLDLEPDMALEPELWPEICTSAELDWLDTRPAPERGRLARLIFSAKECVYKAQYPLTGMMLGFDAFGIAPDLAAGTFTATAMQPLPPLSARARFNGRQTVLRDVLATVVRYRTAAPDGR